MMAKQHTCNSSVSSPADRKARLDACRACMGCGATIAQLIRRVGYAELVCPQGKWTRVGAHAPKSVELSADVRELLAAQSRARVAEVVEQRKVELEAKTSAKPMVVPTVRRVANLADKCAACDQDQAEWGSTAENPDGQVVGCKLITSAVIQGHCLSCPKKWKAAVDAGIPPRGCKWRVEVSA